MYEALGSHGVIDTDILFYTAFIIAVLAMIRGIGPLRAVGAPPGSARLARGAGAYLPALRRGPGRALPRPQRSGTRSHPRQALGRGESYEGACMSIELAHDGMEGEVEDPNVMLYFNGRDKPAYRCECGANVFSRLTPISEGWRRYRCNGCDQEMEAQ